MYETIEPGSAVVKVDPEQDTSVQNLLVEMNKLKFWAGQLQVTTEEDAKKATADLSIMSRLAKAVEAKRQEYVSPLNQYVDKVNATFKTLSVPLDEAFRGAKAKVTAFKVEQDRRRREAEELNRQAIELAQKQAAANQGEFTVDTTPVPVPMAPKTTRGEAGMGSSTLGVNWKYEVVDFKLLPDEYKVADTAMLNAIAKKHHDTKPVPGVRFFNEPNLTVRG